MKPADPGNASSHDRGTTFGGQDLRELATAFGTPLYIYDAEIIRRRMTSAREVLAGLDARFFFAVKANGNPHLLSIMREGGFGADLVSQGELAAAHRAGMAGENLLLNGNGKDQGVRDAFLAAQGQFVSLDTPDELPLWERAPVRRLLRINPDIMAGGHPLISTGGKHHKFGVPPDRIAEIAGHLVGLHVHIGSQISNPAPFAAAYAQIIDLTERFGFPFLDIGGGWAVEYDRESPGLDPRLFRERIHPVLKRFSGTLLVELGRWVIAPAGLLLSRIIRIKSGERHFVVADAGMNDLIRPALYDAVHSIRVIPGSGEAPPSESSPAAPVRCDVVGPLCETGDVLAHDRNLGPCGPGDLLVIGDTGAYGYSMASQYNGIPRPAEVLIDRGTVRLIRRRESVADLFLTIPD